MTTTSTAGWLPSDEQERQARQAAIDYLADTDGGQYAEAYARLAAQQQAGLPLTSFTAHGREFNSRAGAVIERRIVKVTWTHKPARAPAPGLYVALDLISRFKNIDRHCGYLVLYQAPSGGPFQVMREESASLDNETAANISRRSLSELERVWAKTSANCPGYQNSVDTTSYPLPSGPLPESPGEGVGYPTVEAALAALRAKPGVTITTNDEWTIAVDEGDMAVWSFAPSGHPAYPAVVKRNVVQKGAVSHIVMSVKCGASKQACDDLVRSFHALNARTAESLRKN